MRTSLTSSEGRQIFDRQSVKEESRSLISSDESQKQNFAKIVFHDESTSKHLITRKNHENFSEYQVKRKMQRDSTFVNDALKVSCLSKPENNVKRKTCKNSLFINEKLNENIEVPKINFLRPKSACCSALLKNENRNEEMFQKKDSNYLVKKSEVQTAELSLEGSKVAKQSTVYSSKKNPQYFISNYFHENSKSTYNLSSFLPSRKSTCHRNKSNQSSKLIENYKTQPSDSKPMCTNQLCYVSKDILLKINSNQNDHKNSFLFHKESSYESASQVFSKKTAHGRPKSAISGKIMGSSPSVLKIFENKTQKTQQKVAMPRKKNTSPDKLYNNSFKKQKIRRRKRPEFKKVEKVKACEEDDPQILIEQIGFSVHRGNKEYYTSSQHKLLTNKSILEKNQNAFKRSNNQGKRDIAELKVPKNQEENNICEILQGS